MGFGRSKGYDHTLDRCLAEAPPFYSQGNEIVKVRVMQYSESEPKVQISRYFQDLGEEHPTKLGRLTVAEAEHVLAVLPALIQEVWGG